MISVEVIRKSREFLEVISNGNKFTKSGIVIYYLNNKETDKFKIGISIKKQVGNSVIRNKLRRQIKSLFRQELFILSGVSIVLIVMNNNQVLNYSSIKNILLPLVRIALATTGGIILGRLTLTFLSNKDKNIALVALLTEQAYFAPT